MGTLPRSRYLTRSTEVATFAPRGALQKLFFLLAAFLTLATLTFTVVGHVAPEVLQSSSPALADDKSPKDIVGEAVNMDEGKFDEALGNNSGEDTDGLGYLLNRMFGLRYINSIEDNRKILCKEGSRAQSPMDHNCDVPNLMTEFLQDMVALLLPTGPQNATVSSAKVALGIGVPYGITVPATDKEAKTRKYTALELYGYNLKYTSYYGEWDHLKVATSARMMANFGWKDNLKLGAEAVSNGIKGGLKGSLKGIASTKNPVKAVIRAVTWGAQGAAQSTIKTVMDASDENVFATYGWYRVGYGNTLYNARELTQTEMAAVVNGEVLNLVQGSDPATAGLPPDYAALKDLTITLQSARAKCEAHVGSNRGGQQELVEITDPAEGKSTTGSGIKEALCKTLAAQKPYSDKNPLWTKDGNRKEETLATWRQAHSEDLTLGQSYGISCPLDTKLTGPAAETAASAFNSCWRGQWEAHKGDAQKKEQDQADSEWFEKTFGADVLSKIFSGPSPRNFNAPWSRYICLKANGDTMVTTTSSGAMDFVYLYDVEGKSNPACAPTRPTVQNGFFGSGYDAKFDGGGPPGVDTRYSAVRKLPLLAMVVAPAYSLVESGAPGAFGLGVAKYMTMLSNKTIDLAFSPIMETLKLNSFLASMVKSFANSIYFPFITVFATLGLLLTLLRAARRGAYREGVQNVAIICGVVIFGAVLFYNPYKTFRTVDALPSKVETVILAPLFDGEGADRLCTVTRASGESEELTKRRVIECEVWRAFVFEPWLHGQWGTNYGNLYAADSGRSEHLMNKNGALVGDAAVDMGGYVTENNWALYQLDVLTSGSSTTTDPKMVSGTPRNFYRLVDLQAGPQGGKDSDGRYFDSWRGAKATQRNIAGLAGGATAIAGFVVIFTYSILKIELSLLLPFMLLLLPFILLLGVLPGAGQTKFKNYLGTVVAIMVQRLCLVFALALLLKLVVAISENTSNFLLASLMNILLCCILFIHRKKIMNFMNDSVAGVFGGVMARRLVENPGGTMLKSLPRSIRMAGGSSQAKVRGAAMGFTAGMMTGGFDDAKKYSKVVADRRASRFDRTRLRQGKLGAYNKYKMVSDDVKSKLKREAIHTVNDRSVVKLVRQEEKDRLYREYRDLWTRYETAPVKEAVAKPPTTFEKYLADKGVEALDLNVEDRATQKLLRKFSEAEDTIKRLQRAVEDHEEEALSPEGLTTERMLPSVPQTFEEEREGGDDAQEELTSEELLAKLEERKAVLANIRHVEVLRYREAVQARKDALAALGEKSKDYREERLREQERAAERKTFLKTISPDVFKSYRRSLNDEVIDEYYRKQNGYAYEEADAYEEGKRLGDEDQ